jgi:hypothetical protein
LAEAKDCLTAIHGSQAILSNALSARTGAFAPLSKLATRINNAVGSLNIPQQSKEQVSAIVRKIQGRRATPKMTEEEKQAAIEAGQAVVEISSSQMSIDNRLDNFNKLINFLMAISAYSPNEVDLSVAQLLARYETMYAKNRDVINADGPLSNLRITRNNLLYGETTGIVDVAIAAKMYIKSVFGADSPQYKQVGSLSFRRYNGK